MPTPDQRPGQQRPFGLPNLSPDGVGGSGGNDPLVKFIWKPAPEFVWCGFEADLLSSVLQKRGFAIVGNYYAQQCQEIGMIAIPRTRTPEELREPKANDLTYAVINPQVADLRLVPVELQNHRTARRQAEEGYVSLGSDIENRQIYVRTQTDEERMKRRT